MNAVDVGMFFRVIHDLAFRHQIHHNLRRTSCGAEALDNVWVAQSHPYRDFLTKRLMVVDYVNGQKERRMNTYFPDISSSSLSILNRDFDRLDADPFRICVPLNELPLPYVGITPRGEIPFTCPREEPLGDYVGSWEHFPFTTNTP